MIQLRVNHQHYEIEYRNVNSRLQIHLPVNKNVHPMVGLMHVEVPSLNTCDGNFNMCGASALAWSLRSLNGKFQELLRTKDWFSGLSTVKFLTKLKSKSSTIPVQSFVTIGEIGAKAQFNSRAKGQTPKTLQKFHVCLNTWHNARILLKSTVQFKGWSFSSPSKSSLRVIDRLLSVRKVDVSYKPLLYLRCSLDRDCWLRTLNKWCRKPYNAWMKTCIS